MSIPEVVGLVTIGGVCLAIIRWGWPRYRKSRETFAAIAATLVGTEEKRHPITKEITQHAQPGVGKQVADLTQVVTKLVDQQAHTEVLQAQVHDHEKRLVALEEARAERVVTQIESAQMWRAVAAVNENDDDPDPAA